MEEGMTCHGPYSMSVLLQRQSDVCGSVRIYVSVCKQKHEVFRRELRIIQAKDLEKGGRL